MTAKKIVYWPDKVLQKTCAPITEFSEEIKQLAKDLEDTMSLYGGVGIAAPQIGVGLQMFVISWEILPDCSSNLVFINPEITSVSQEEVKGEEGCLSFPDIFLWINRPKKVSLTAYNLSGEKFSMDAEGYAARAILHERDHLSGKLFLQFAGQVKRDMVKKKMEKFRKKIDDTGR